MRNVLGWQICSRLAKGIHDYPWIGSSRLLVGRGMTGATGNIYYGLHEFHDMGFLLHFLRAGDLFGDVGANVGSYTVLAGRVCGADVVGFEPDPDTLQHYRANIAANRIENRTTVIEAAAGGREGFLDFTVGLDAMNHVVGETATEVSSRRVRVTTLDTAFAQRIPILLKIDVEGFEEEVIFGAVSTLAHSGLKCIEIESVSDALLEHLKRGGFERCTYDPFARRLIRGDGERIGHNHLFVRDRPFVEQRLRDAIPFEVMGQQI